MKEQASTNDLGEQPKIVIKTNQKDKKNKAKKKPYDSKAEQFLRFVNGD